MQTYLSSEEFKTKFGMSKDAFYKLPKWKQNKLKMSLHLFWSLAQLRAEVKKRMPGNLYGFFYLSVYLPNAVASFHTLMHGWHSLYSNETSSLSFWDLGDACLHTHWRYCRHSALTSIHFGMDREFVCFFVLVSYFFWYSFWSEVCCELAFFLSFFVAFFFVCFGCRL